MADGDVENESVGDFEVIPIEGEPFERLFMMNGRMLSEEEQGWVAESEAEFRKEVIARRETGAEPEDDGSTDSNRLRRGADRPLPLHDRGRRGLPKPPQLQGVVPSPARPATGGPPHRLRAQQRERLRLGGPRHLRAGSRRVRADPAGPPVVGAARRHQPRARLAGPPSDSWGDDDLWARIQLESYSDSRVLFSRTLRREFRTWRDFEAVEH